MARWDGLFRRFSPNPFLRDLARQLVRMATFVAGYAWIDQRASGLYKVRSEAIRLVKTAFDGAGVDMPEPTHRVRLDGDVARAAAPERDARAPPARARSRTVGGEEDLLDERAPRE